MSLGWEWIHSHTSTIKKEQIIDIGKMDESQMHHAKLEVRRKRIIYCMSPGLSIAKTKL